MGFVKGNSSCFFLGDQERNYDFLQLANLGISQNEVTIFSIDEKFSYKENSSKSTRLHSRKTSIILECLFKLDFESLKRHYQTDRIGFYLNSSRHLYDENILDFNLLGSHKTVYQLMRDKLAPTYVIKNETGIIPGHVCIFYDINGPSFTVTSRNLNQIFQKAQLDIESGFVDLAVIAISNLYDDPIAILQHSQKNVKLNEAVGVLLLTKSSKVFEDLKITFLNDRYYGFLDDLKEIKT